ncbi:MAG: hypothetical protein K0S56_335 [Microvirga sp.]|nr:hypothetical protein [Microvirga sp.]
MPDHIFIDSFGGTIKRLRTALIGYDASNLALDERYLTFDSFWLNGLRLLSNGVRTAASLTDFTVTYPAAGAYTPTRRVKILPSAGNNQTRPTLAWVRRGPGTMSYTPSSGAATTVSYQRGYGTCGVTLQTNSILLSPQRTGVDYVFYVFGVNGTAAEGGGGNGIFFGNHPLHGPGLHISRPGIINVDTAGLDDMLFTTRRNAFQIAETGTVGVTGSTTSDPLGQPEQPSTLWAASVVTLARSYPNYPPVIAYGMGLPNHTESGCQIYWLSANQILITSSGAGSNIRYAIVGGDPAWEGGADPGAGITRCFASAAEGLAVTRAGVDYDVSTPADLIFSSKRMFARFKDFAAINASAPTGSYFLPDPPPSGAGAPFPFFMLYDQQANYWWCANGSVSFKGVMMFDSGLGVYLAYEGLRGYVSSRTTYGWDRPSSYTVTAPGFASMLNVSDV